MKRIILFISLFSLFGILTLDLSATTKRKSTQTNVLRGMYIPSDLVTKVKLKDLPVPNNGQDYAFYQSIGNASNVIIGDFKSGKNIITLISDSNNDGEVDSVSYFTTDDNKFREAPRPKSTVSKEQFLKMKQDITDGRIATLAPNPEGVLFLKKIVSQRDAKPVNIAKSKQGYVIYLKDPDDTAKNRITYSFSDNGINGVDIYFTVFYHNVGEFQIVPIITTSVYCKSSSDPFAKGVVEDLGKYITENYRE